MVRRRYGGIAVKLISGLDDGAGFRGFEPSADRIEARFWIVVALDRGSFQPGGFGSGFQCVLDLVVAAMECAGDVIEDRDWIVHG